jgi:hypothetical protein
MTALWGWDVDHVVLVQRRGVVHLAVLRVGQPSEVWEDSRGRRAEDSQVDHREVGDQGLGRGSQLAWVEHVGVRGEEWAPFDPWEGHWGWRVCFQGYLVCLVPCA